MNKYLNFFNRIIKEGKNQFNFTNILQVFKIQLVDSILESRLTQLLRINPTRSGG